MDLAVFLVASSNQQGLSLRPLTTVFVMWSNHLKLSFVSFEIFTRRAIAQPAPTRLNTNLVKSQLDDSSLVDHCFEELGRRRLLVGGQGHHEALLS